MYFSCSVTTLGMCLLTPGFLQYPSLTLILNTIQFITYYSEFSSPLFCFIFCVRNVNIYPIHPAYKITTVLLPISVMLASSGSPTDSKSYTQSTKTKLCHIVAFPQHAILTHSPSYIQYIALKKGYRHEQYHVTKFIPLCH